MRKLLGALELIIFRVSYTEIEIKCHLPGSFSSGWIFYIPNLQLPLIESLIVNHVPRVILMTRFVRRHRHHHDPGFVLTKRRDGHRREGE